MKFFKSTLFSNLSQRTGSALMMVVVTLTMIGLSSIAITYFFEAAHHEIKIQDQYDSAKSIVNLIESNFANKTICKILVGAGDLNLDGGNLLNVAQANSTQAGQKFSQFKIGVRDAANVEIPFMKDSELTEYHLKLADDVRFQCNTPACDCEPVIGPDITGDGIPDPTGACFDADPLTAGLQSRIAGNFIIPLSLTSTPPRSLSPRKIPASLEVDDVTKNLLGCELQDSPPQQCEKLGGLWNAGACKMPYQPFDCPVGFAAGPDINGDTIPDCVNPYTPIECPFGEYVTKITNGALTCAVIGYGWYSGPWGACIGGTKWRSVNCINVASSSLPVADINCVAAAKPTDNAWCPVWNWALSGCAAGVGTYNCENQLGAISGNPAVDCPMAQPVGACPSDCVLDPAKTWGAGVCSAAVGPLAHGAVQAVVADAPNAGNANFECNDGNYVLLAGSTCAAPIWAWTPTLCIAGNITHECRDQFNNLSSNEAVDCAVPPKPADIPCVPPNCPANPALSWTVNTDTCVAAAPATNDGLLTGVLTDAVGPATGNANFMCVSGVFQVQPGATCSSPADCVAQPLSWTVAGNTCSANAPATVNAAMTGALNDPAPPPNGSANFQCLNGSFVEQLGSSCDSAAGCPASPVTWTVGTENCSSATLVATAEGALTGPLNDLFPNPQGKAEFKCVGGSLVIQPGATCAKMIDGVWADWRAAAQVCPANYVHLDIRDDSENDNHKLWEDGFNGHREDMCILGFTGYWAPLGGCGADVDGLVRDEASNKHQLNENNGGPDVSTLCLVGVSDAMWAVVCPPGYTTFDLWDDSDAVHNINEGNGRNGPIQNWCIKP